MSSLKKIKEMDIVKLRIIIISALVISFVACLVMLKLMANRLGISGGTPVLLKLVREDAPLVSASDVEGLNRLLGKRATVEGRVEGTLEDKGGWILKLSNVSVVMGHNQMVRLKREGLTPEQMKGMKIRATGRLRVRPDLGIALIMEQDDKLEFVAGRR